MKKKTYKLLPVYETLSAVFGPQYWWPGETPFEIMVGAILTQNTNWGNVERAIENLKNNRCLTPGKMYTLPPEKLAELIRPAGYFNVKARRLHNFLAWLVNDHDADIARLKKLPLETLRPELLAINGVGPETADSILLYALDKLTFVVDAYTRRVLSRHNFIPENSSYDAIKTFCEAELPLDLQLYNEFHALIVRTGKDFCKPKTRCENCPLKNAGPRTQDVEREKK